MSIMGGQHAVELLTSALDPGKLVRLCADVLFCRGHSSIRMTDGPGDGGRDLHSLINGKERYLTQCKYHSRPRSSCSSSQLSELPMAMVKLSYKQGLFATNGKISPQAKREFLDNYPDLTLEFLDGEALAREVLSNTLLRALWFDEKNFAEVSVQTVFPLLIRCHTEDLPLDLFDGRRQAQQYINSEPLMRAFPKNRFLLRQTVCEAEPFAPYRAPEPPTGLEGPMPFLRVHEVVVEGKVDLCDIASVASSLSLDLIENLGDDYGGLTVRIGRPYICPLFGERSGMKIPTPSEPVSYIQADSVIEEELAWFSVGENDCWSRDCDARVTEREWVRLYSETLDSCLSYEIVTRASSSEILQILAGREILLKGWDESIFCLLPEWENWEQVSIPEPDEKVKWPWDGRMLCAWLHPSLLGGIVTFRSRDFHFQEEDEFFAVQPEIKKALEKLDNFEIVAPYKARHMVAIAGVDPFPDPTFSTIGSADTIAYLETLPSPIRPDARRFEVTVAWKTTLPIETVEEVFKSISQGANGVRFRQPYCRQVNEYVSASFPIEVSGLFVQSTRAILIRIHEALDVFLSPFEVVLAERDALTRCTKEYWAKSYGVNLGMPENESDKVVVWRRDENGNVVPLATMASADEYLNS